jgi:hypothetical protein
LRTTRGISPHARGWQLKAAETRSISNNQRDQRAVNSRGDGYFRRNAAHHRTTTDYDQVVAEPLWIALLRA